jgi:hypothetical protein
VRCQPAASMTSNGIIRMIAVYIKPVPPVVSNSPTFQCPVQSAPAAVVRSATCSILLRTDPHTQPTINNQQLPRTSKLKHRKNHLFYQTTFDEHDSVDLWKVWDCEQQRCQGICVAETVACAPELDGKWGGLLFFFSSYAVVFALCNLKSF